MEDVPERIYQRILQKLLMKSIPKICYMYFGGSSNLPMLMVFTVISFHRLNPDWQIILYRTKQTNAELGRSPYDYSYTGKDYFHLIEAMDFVEIRTIDVDELGINRDVHSILGSDIFRTKVLYEKGGLYSDLDVIWLKPMSELVNASCIGDPADFECSVCFYNLTHGHHTVSNLIAKAGSPFLASVIEEQGKIRPPYADCSFSTFLLNRKYPTLDTITSKYPRVLALRYETFYPYSIFEMERLWLKNDLLPIESKNVICVHWFNGHPLSVEYTNRDKFEFNCSMTSILKKEDYI
ncbi:MAG: glycosyltransferase [Bacteroidales bacterium]